MSVTRVGGEFLVNTGIQDEQTQSAVTGLTGSGFVVSWTSYGDPALGASGIDVFAQRYGADGSRIGSSFSVPSEIANEQSSPTITGLTNGGFVVSWADRSGLGSDPYGVRAQIFQADGSAVGSEFLVNTRTADDQESPAITALSNGGFVVSWSDLSGPSADRPDIAAQVFDENGTKVGSEIHVNTPSSGFQSNASVTGLTNGGFLVT